MTELTCEIPKNPLDIEYKENTPGKPAGGFLIELTNDGKTFSVNKTLLLVYDSKCMECLTNEGQTDGRCGLKVHKMMIII